MLSTRTHIHIHAFIQVCTYAHIRSVVVRKLELIISPLGMRISPLGETRTWSVAVCTKQTQAVDL